MTNQFDDVHNWDHVRRDDTEAGFSSEVAPSYTQFSSVSRGQGIGDWADTLRQGWQVDEVAAEIGQESQARIAVAGLPGVGKRSFYNFLRGWTMDWQDRPLPTASEPHIEPLGLFVLADLPAMIDFVNQPLLHESDSLLITLGAPSLIVYFLEAESGVTQADYRWIAALRTCGRPIVVVLNHRSGRAKQTLIDDVASKLGMPVIPISTYGGWNIEKQLLPALLDAAPKLAVPIGREVVGMRRKAARRVIRHTSLLTMLLGAQPVPGLELPFLALTHVGLTMRIGAAYGKHHSGGMRRETVLTIGGVMVCQYAIQTVVKFVPMFGALIAGVLSGLTTLLIGEIALRFHESGFPLPRPKRPRIWNRSVDPEDEVPVETIGQEIIILKELA